jgi:uncharacterized membrane protein (UPF0127 family)
LALPLVIAAAAVVLVAWFGFTPKLGAASRPDRISITTDSGAHAFSVEWAVTEPEREQGLMFRQSMPADHGMIFDFDVDSPVYFWMKNTPLPLDMVFITSDGTIARIEQNAEPYSERNIPSGAPVRYVLEINGGVAKRIGAKPGDKVDLH